MGFLEGFPPLRYQFAPYVEWELQVRAAKRRIVASLKMHESTPITDRCLPQLAHAMPRRPTLTIRTTSGWDFRATVLCVFFWSRLQRQVPSRAAARAAKVPLY